MPGSGDCQPVHAIRRKIKAAMILSTGYHDISPGTGLISVVCMRTSMYPGMHVRQVQWYYVRAVVIRRMEIRIKLRRVVNTWVTSLVQWQANERRHCCHGRVTESRWRLLDVCDDATAWFENSSLVCTMCELFL